MAETGLQLYTIKELCSEDFKGALELVAEMGYKGVEFAGFYDMPADELKQVLDSLGLAPCGSHTAIDILKDDFDGVVEYNKKIGNEYIVVPWLGEEYRKTKEDWIATAKMLNDFNKRLKAKGLRLGYHNHAFEFEKFDGVCGYDLLAQNTDLDIILEMDTYWVEYAGFNLNEYIKKYKDRLELLHIKDMAEDRTSTEAGNGTMDFTSVIDETKETTKWFIVEQEHFTRSHAEAIKMSCDYVQGVLNERI